jgi:ribosomal protein S18 acetylase RimI-like enzyme
LSSDKPAFGAIENAEAESWAEIHSHVAPAFRERVGLRVQRIAGAITAFALNDDMASLNRCWLPGTEPAVTAGALEEIVAYARSLGKERFIAHCPTWAGSPELMEEHGFRTRLPMMQLFRRPSTDVPESPFRIEEIGAGERELFGQVAAEANELPGWLSDGFNATVDLAGWHHYLAFDGDTPIAAAGLRAQGEYAWCCFAGTTPGFRRRGVQSALLNRRIHDAAEAGCDWIIAETSVNPVSFRNLQRAGFEVVYERPNYLADLTT